MNLLLSEDGVVLKSAFREVRLAWREIAIFKAREYTSRFIGGLPVFFTPRDTHWVITSNGKQYAIRRLAHEQLHELNLAVDEGRVKGHVDLARFAGDEWQPFLYN